METIPYQEYVFSGARQLITDLGPNNVFLMTKSPDVAYQRQKLDACNLPFFRDNVHEWIVEAKNPDVFAQWIAMMQDRGATHLVYGSDEAPEILFAHDAAVNAGLGFEGVHHQYGPYWKEGLGRAEHVLGNHYHPARNFRQFAHIIRGFQSRLEGQSQPIERKVSYGKEKK